MTRPSNGKHAARSRVCSLTGLGRCLGRRGAFLLLYGLIWALLGYSLTQTFGQPHGLEPIVGSVITIQTWGWLWVLVGLNAMAHSVRRSPGADGFGFYPLIAPASIWAMSYASTYVQALFRGEDDAGYLAALIFAALALTVPIIAGWPEPEGHKPPDVVLPDEGATPGGDPT